MALDLESDPVISRRLSSLPLWTSLQALGRDTIGERILMSFEACRVVQDIVSKCYGIRILVGVLLLGNWGGIEINPLIFSTEPTI